MPNLTVSSAVDAFMQASDQAEMVAALGTLPGGLPLQAAEDNAPILYNSDSDELVGIDTNNNPTVSASGSGDQINFSSGGVASVTAAADSLQLPIGRVVGKSSYSLSNGGFGTTINAQDFLTVEIAVTGSKVGDAIAVSFDGALPGFDESGGIVVSSCWADGSGNVYVQLVNTDPNSIYNVGTIGPGNVYVTVTR